VSVPSQPPPSQTIPEKSGGGLYLLGALVLVGGAVGLYMWKKPAPTATPQATTVAATATQKPEVAAPLYAPPPPPKMDEEDAGTDAGVVAAKAPVGTGTPAPGPCAGTCTGTATGGLSSALRGRAGSAQGCYNRALRTSEVSGALTVSVQVGPSGQVCAASIVNDSVHSNEISNCVLSRFRGQSFPPPSGGCVTVNIPISFSIKTN
jgi:TonB family protein